MRLFVVVSSLSLAACGAQAPGDPAPAQPSSALASCTACHSLKAAGPKRSGPHLAGVIGRKAGSLTGYAYSAAMKRSDFVWTQAALDAFLADPTSVIPGTRMSMRVPDAQRREQIIEELTVGRER